MPQSQQKHYWPLVDALRFLAACMVVVYHFGFGGWAAPTPAGPLMATPWPGVEGMARYGYLGVNLFFIISGFVIARSSEGRSASAFLWARLGRLYPAFFVACLLTFAITRFSIHPAIHTPWAALPANLAALYPLLGLPPIDGAYWSLVVEVQFYLGVAMLLWAGRGQWLLPLALGWLGAATLQLHVLHLPGLNTLLAAWWAPYFAAGIALHYLAEGTRTRLALAVWGLAVAAAFPSTLMQAAQTFQPPHPAALIVILAGLFLLMLAAAAIRRTRPWPGVVLLGGLTYPLYLTHQYIGYTLVDALAPHLSANLALALTLALILAAAYAIHAYAEPTGRRLLTTLRTRITA